MKENESRKWLYNQLTSEGYNVGKDYAEFDSLMTNNADSRKWAFDEANKLGYNVGKDYDEFESLINPVDVNPEQPNVVTEEQLEDGSADMEQGKTPQPVTPISEVKNPVIDPSKVKPMNELAAQTTDTTTPYMGFTPNLETPEELPSDKMRPTFERPLSDRERKRMERSIELGNIGAEHALDGTGKIAKNVTDYVNKYGIGKDSVAETKFNPESGKIETEYVSPVGNKTTSKAVADAEDLQFRTAVEEGPRDVKSDFEKLKGNIDRQWNEQRGKSVERYTDEATNNPFLTAALSSAGMSVPGDIQMKVNETVAERGGVNKDSDALQRDIQSMDAAKRVMENTERTIREAEINEKNGTLNEWLDSSFYGGVKRGFKHGAKDVFNSRFGITDMQDATAVLSAVEKAEKGENLSSGEQALLDAYAMQMRVLSEYGDKVGFGYSAGKTTAEMFPFMAEMLLNPLNTLGKKAAGKTVKYFVEKYGKGALKKGVKNYAVKGVSSAARVAADAVAGLGMALTSGAAQTVADAESRMAGTFNAGNKYSGVSDRESLGTAVTKATTAQGIERQSELVGGYFGALNKSLGGLMSRWLGKSKVGRNIYDFFDGIHNSSFAKDFNDFLGKTQWNGMFGEIAEEFIGGAENALIVGDQTLDTNPQTGLFNMHNALETVIGVSLFGGLVSAVKTAGYRTPTYEAKKDMAKADRQANSFFKDNEEWAHFKSLIEGGDIDAIAESAEMLLKDTGASPEKRRAVLNYVGAAGNYIGAKRTKEERHNRTPGTPKEAIQLYTEDSYDEGYNTVESQEKNSAKVVLEHDKENLREQFPYLVQNVFDNMSDADWVEKAVEAHSQEEADAIVKYLNAKAKFEGILDRVRDTIDEKIAVSNAQVDQHVNMDGGYVLPATMKDGNRKVYVIKGNLSANEDGTIDVMNSSPKLFIRDSETGDIEMTTPNFLLSVDGALDPNEEKEMLAEQIRQSIAAESAAEIDGVAPAEGEQPQANETEGGPATEQLQATANEGGSIESGQPEAVAEQPKTALAQIPTDEQGKPVFEQAESPKAAYDALLEMSKGDSEIAASAVSFKLAEKEKAVKDLGKAKITPASNSMEDIIAAQQERKALIAQAQSEVEFWKGVLAAKDAPVVEEAVEQPQANETQGDVTKEVVLSEEEDNNGANFVIAPNGTTTFGTIGQETGLTSAPIKLSEGIITNPETNAGYGLVHIEARHGEEIRNAGYKSVLDFISDVATRYDRIVEGVNREHGGETYLVQLIDEHNNTLYIELSKDGSYWNINSAGIFNKKYASGRKEVYNRHTQVNQSAEISEGSPTVEQSGTQTEASTMPSTHSLNKDSEAVDSDKEMSVKNSEGDAEPDFENDAEYQKLAAKLDEVEQSWQERIQNYIAEHYPTQATVSAQTKSPEGMKEREAMKVDKVLKDMIAQSEAEIDAVDRQISEYMAAVEQPAANANEETAEEAVEEPKPESRTARKQENVPDWLVDSPKDARERGYRRVSGKIVDRQEPIEAVRGKEVNVKFSTKKSIPAYVTVIDAEELQPSHVQGYPNSVFFIDEAQPKARTDEASIYAAQQIGAHINPEEITSGTTAYTGAPTVNTRGEVIQGNSRSDALKYMYQEVPASAEKYKQYLIDNAVEFGLNGNDITAMEHPVLVNMADVTDKEAIELGQFTAQDTESGGVERIKAKNTIQKLGDRFGRFAEMLLNSEDENATFSELVDKNGVDTLKWLQQIGAITDTQYQSALTSKANLSGEARNDLKNILFEAIFKDSSVHLEKMFGLLPAKAQRAIMATAHRDLNSPKGHKLVPDIQNAIVAYYEVQKTPEFQKAKTEEDLLRAIDTWSRQYAFDEISGESYVPSDIFDTFAMELASYFKSKTQRFIQETLNGLYDKIQGVPSDNIFEQGTTEPITLTQAKNQILGIHDKFNNVKERDLTDAIDSGESTERRQGSTGNATSGKPSENGEGTSDSGRSTEGVLREESEVEQPKTKPTKKKVKKLNLFDYVDKKGDRPILAGILHRDGKQVASDSIVMVITKEDYDKSLENVVTDKNGEKIKGNYPSLKFIEGRKYKNKTAISPSYIISQIKDIIKNIKESNDGKLPSGYKFSNYIKLRIGNTELEMNINAAEKFFNALDKLGVDTITLSNDGIAVLKGQTDVTSVYVAQGFPDYKNNDGVFPVELTDPESKLSIKEDSEQTSDTLNEQAPGTKAKQEFGLKRDEYTETLAVADWIDKLAKKLGLTVEFAPDEEVGGGTANAEITGNHVKIAKGDKTHGLRFLTGHEFTHYMQTTSPEAYEKFKDAVKKAMGKQFQTRLLHLSLQYKKAGIKISLEGLEDEIVADYAGEIVENTETADKFMNGINQDKNLIQRIIDALKHLRDFFTDRNIYNLDNAIKKFEDLLNESETNKGTASESAGKYSLKDKTLVGIHNISAGKLRKALKMGGLANPSTAVIDADKQDFDKYGEISLIMPSAMVDKKTGQNAGTYFGDAWTPTYPQIKRRLSDKMWKKYDKRLAESIEDDNFRRFIHQHFNEYLDGGYSEKQHFLFLKEKGIEPKVVIKSAPGFNMERLESLLGYKPDGSIEEFRNKFKELPIEKQRELRLRQITGFSDKKYNKALENARKYNVSLSEIYDLDNIGFSDYNNAFYDIFSKGRDSGEIDDYRTIREAEDYVRENNLEDEYAKWLEDLTNSLEPEEVFWSGTDSQGRNIYRKNTLENVSRHMKKEGKTNVYDNTGLSATKASLLKKVNTLKAIRSSKDRLSSEEEYNKVYDELSDKLFGITEELADMEKISDNKFINRDYAEMRLQDAFTKSNPISYLNSEYGYNIRIDGDFAEKLNKFISEVSNMPATYFETKFERPVYLNEFAAAVVPNNIDADLRGALEDAGLDVYDYEPDNKESRREATQKATQQEGVRFSLKDGGYTAEEQSILYNAPRNEEGILLAPNGRVSNLTEKQYAQVRTKAFKNWFGDWEKVFRVDKLRKSEPIVITGDEYIGKYELIRDSAKSWIKNSLRNNYKNKDTGDIIEIRKDGAQKVTSHSMGNEMHVKSLAVIPELIEKSIFIEELPNEKNNGKYDSYRYYVCGLKIGETDYTVKITIGVKGSNKYYDHSLTEIEKGKLIDNIDALSTTFDNNKNALSSFKDTKLISILQTNASKVVDENGEPLVVYHGTRKTNEDGTLFTQFKANKILFFSDNKEVGDYYAGMENEKPEWRGRVYDSFLNIKKPLIVDAEGNGWDNIRLDGTKQDTIDIARKAFTEGYDGVIINDLYEAGFRGNDFLAFNPNQIKSATDNAGTFKTDSEDVRYSIRQEPAPEHTGKGYKVFVLKDGKLYPPMVANPNGDATPFGVWLNADAAPVVEYSKTGRPKVKSGGKGTQGGSGTLAYRPGWHLGEIPYALQFGRKDENGERTLFPKDFVWAEVEYADDVDYQEEAMSYGTNASGKFQHSLAGLPKVPKDGSYKYRTNPNPETDPWIITGAMKVNRLLTPSEVDEIVVSAGREPQIRQDGAYTDADINTANKELQEDSRYSFKGPELYREGNGHISDDEVSFANDPVSKALGYMRYSPKRRHEFAERERARMVTRINGLCEKLNLDNVEVVTSDSLEGRKAKAKGFFNTNTGKITIVLDNHVSSSDAEQTLFHEAVAHYGLRKMFGEHFNTFLDNVYNNASKEIKSAIDKSAQENSRDTRTATEEYLATLAEDINYEKPYLHEWWGKIKHFFIEMLDKIGVKLPMLTDNELRYILYVSGRRLESRDAGVFGVAEDIAIQNRLKVGNYAEQTSAKDRAAEDENLLLFRYIGEKGAALLDKFDEGAHRLENLSIAKEMFKAGENARTIKFATGWELGVDNKWKYDTKDYDSLDLNKFKVGPNESKVSVPLKDCIEDKSLFTAYPEFNDVVLKDEVLSEGTSGQYNPETKTISIDISDRIAKSGSFAGNYVGKTLIHEIQHIIQEIEGFAVGGSPNMTKQNLSNEEKKLIAAFTAERNKLFRELKSIDLMSALYGFDESRRARFEKRLNSIQESILEIDSQIENILKLGEDYFNLAGEVESRDTARKLNWDNSKRREYLATDTEDVSRADQIVIYDGLSAYNEMNSSKESIRLMSQELADELHTPLRMVESVEEIKDSNLNMQRRKRSAKGWYDVNTGEVFIVLPNADSVSDARKTIFHEVVGHKGLRELLGKDFDKFLYNVYANANDSIRTEISKRMLRNGWSVHEATEEYLARLAERGFDNVKERNFYQRVKEAFLELLRQAGIHLGFKLTDTELRYVLWRSYQMQKNKGVFGAAEDVVMQNKLGVGNFAPRFRDEEGTIPFEMRNRAAVRDYMESLTTINPKTGKVKFTDFVKGIWGDTKDYLSGESRNFGSTKNALKKYKQNLRVSKYQAQEALQDSMLSLKRFQEELARQTKRPIADYENAYIAENALSSKNEAEIFQYWQRMFKPLIKTLSDIEKKGYSEDDITDYLFGKHGLERNKVFAMRDAEKQAEEDTKKWEAELMSRQQAAFHAKEQGFIGEEQYLKVEERTKKQLDKRDEHKNKLIEKYNKENLKNDYAGLTALADESDVEEATKIITEYVEDFENSVGNLCDVLWDQINAANDAILLKQLETGMIGAELYEKLSTMFEYYVPLRGWEEDTADDVYAYLSDNKGPFNAPIQGSRGRRSKADQPIPTILNMAASSILQGNRNKMKDKFLTLVQNRPNDEVSVSSVWLQFNKLTGEWTPTFAVLNPNDSAEEVERKTKEFNKQMEDYAYRFPEAVKRSHDRRDIPYVIKKKDLNEHQIIVKRDGKDYILTINGNPRLAQALNGLTNPDAEAEGALLWALKKIDWFNRQMSANYTTRNPEFMVSNFSRDMIYSNIMEWVREDPDYALRFNTNCAKYNPVILMNYFNKWQKGTLDLSNLNEKLFYDFIINGGETGYVNLKNIDQNKKDIAREIRKNKGQITKEKAFDALSDTFDNVNRSIENVARFAAFVTSREMGRGIERSVYDAKEVSVNFNKKGSGSKFAGKPGQTTLGTIAAGVSGFGRRAFVFWNAGIQGMTNFLRLAKYHPKKFILATGIMFGLGLVMPILSMMGYGDGDDDSENYYNLPDYIRRSNICFKYGDLWVTIPLPIELRAIYGLGELATSAMSGYEDLDAEDIAIRVFQQLSQTMPLDLSEGGGGLSPLIPSSVKPVVEAYRTNEDWAGVPIYKDNFFNQHNPEWTRVYKSTNKQLVEITKWANKESSETNDEYSIGDINLNPAKIEHVLEGVFGGYFSMYNKIVKSAETAFGDREFEWRNIPMASRLLTTADERIQNRKINEEYYKAVEDAELARSLYRIHKKNLSDDPEEHSKRMKEVVESAGYITHTILSKYKKPLKQLKDFAENIYISDGEEAKAKLDWAQNMEMQLKKECLKEIEKQTEKVERNK